MTGAASGKTHRDENFPVASLLIQERLRPAILAFYRFARAADDVADHPRLPADEKLALLDRLEETLLGRLGLRLGAGPCLEIESNLATDDGEHLSLCPVVE